MEPTSARFVTNARDAIADENLQLALARVGENFGAKRTQAIAALPEFDALRDRAVEIKDDVLGHLDYYLEVYERAVTASGGHVHWCATTEDARETVLRLCRSVDAKTVTKGKSMIGEEMEINPYLERHGVRPVETDLGEYIIQLADEPPSHIIAPAVHKTKEQVSDLFHEHHRKFGRTERQTEGEKLVEEARELLRDEYLAADVGITGANFLIAETGSSIIVTNEGNGDLTQMLPKMHIVLASLEKVVPTLEDAATLLRILARSASGQEMSSYTTVSTGPRRADDPDGPNEYHVILLDNGRSALLGGEFQDILRCIRCGACYNHCPVYTAVGGHAYGWVYGGPVGSVLTPALIGLEQTRHLPSATPFCGRCEEVCPLRIPLPKMMRHWREQSFQRHLTPGRERRSVALWAWFARRPAIYHLGARLAIGWLSRRARGRGHMRRVPFMRGWTLTRDLPAPEGGTFQNQWRRRKRG